MNSLVWLAVLLVVAWLVLKLTFAVASGFFHLLWVAAIILFILWLFRKMRGKTGV